MRMPIFALFSAIFLFGMLLLTNGIQMLSLLILPFSRKAFRRVNTAAAHAWWGLCVLWAERIQGVRPVYSGDELPEGENAIVIANHQGSTDINVLMALGWQKKQLGHLKWFVKDVIKYVPGIGWGMLFLDCIFLKRDWDRDEGRIRATFRKFLADKIPLWLVSFPEGTRKTPQKLAKSQAYGTQQGIEPFGHLLIPRTHGFSASVIGLREHVKAVYDITIAYPGEAPTLWRLLNLWRTPYFVHVRRFPISELPGDHESLARWLLERFCEKDRLLEGFAKDQRWPA